MADDISAHQLKYTYNADGNLSKIIYPTVQDGVKSLSYQYNKDGWLTEIKAEIISGDDTAEKTVRTYAYDTYGKVREIKDSRNLFGTNDKAVKKTYSYDRFDRVTAMVYTDLETGKEMESYRYEYDKNSNITKKTEINNYPKEDGKKVNESKAYTYDANGNEIKVKNTKTGEIEEKVYDAENRLSEVSVTKDNKTSVVQQNIYNGDGQRIQKTEGNQTTNYYYQDGIVSYTTDETGKQTSQNLIGTEGNIIGTQRYSGDNVSYYLYNKDI